MGEKLEEGELYRGPCGVLRDSAWLSSETIPADKDTIVEIEAVVRRKTVVFKNETKKGYGSLRFKGKDRELGLCATNIKVLKALFGPDTSSWYGQTIALYVDPDVMAFGSRVSAVRIRARRPEVPTANGKASTPSPAARTAPSKAKGAPSAKIEPAPSQAAQGVDDPNDPFAGWDGPTAADGMEDPG